MKKFKKVIFLIVPLIVLVPVIVMAYDVDHSGVGAGNGSSGVNPSVGGGQVFQSRVIGVRVTVVSKDGKRLYVDTGKGKYESNSVDYYGNKSVNESGYFGNMNYSSVNYSKCFKKDGTEVLCSKVDLKASQVNGFLITSGDYKNKAQDWPYQDNNDLKLPAPINDNDDEALDVNNAGTDYYKIPSFSTTFSKFSSDAYKNKAVNLFTMLMGISPQKMIEESSGDCEKIKSMLTDAYIIYEPVGLIGNLVGTATELSYVWGYCEPYKVCYVATALPTLLNNVFVPEHPGNLGLNVIKSVGGPMKSNSNDVAEQKDIIENMVRSNPQIGYGVGILHIKDLLPDSIKKYVCRNYDYSIDAACKNCNVGTNNNHAYVIQDTNNFEAIRNSSSSKVNNVKNYYIKSGAGYSGVYCREEFFVQFPNTVDNRLTLATGRYFTINEDFKKWSDSDNSGITENAAIPNFKPILVTHKRQCTTSDNSNNGKEQLKNFAVASLSNFKSNNGEVKLKYTENMTGSKYKTDFVTLRSKEQSTFVGGVDVTGTTSINKNNINIGSDVGGYPVLTMSTTRTYKLPANFYRYVRISDGLSMINVNGITSTDLSTKYNDLGFSTLPISYKNTNYENAGSVQFYYELPAKSAYTNDIKSAYANEDYFIDKSHSDDIKTLYNYADSEKSNEYMNYDYNNNACIKLYGDASKASSCIAEHKTKKIGNCKNVNSLNNKNANEGYVCNLTITTTTTPPTTPPCDGPCPEPAPSGTVCKIENGTYYLYDKEVTKAEYKKKCPDPDTCPPDKPCPKGPSCEYYNGKYYDNEGNQVDEEIYK